MRAKRSKKYRKIMSAYQMNFSFREPYQVLLDSNFLRTCHAFHMPLQKYLENILHGECRPFVTRCSLAKIMADFEKDPNKHPRAKRPDFLPPPTEVPLRHCKHRNDAGEDIGELDEARCLLDLLAGQPHGNELAKNKQHYILASADAAEDQERRKRKGFIDVRERARMIPGVPIVYVKRSVMILEELSGASEAVRRKAEKEKFSEGLIGLDRKRKRGEGDADSDDEDLGLGDSETGPKVRGAKRAKGPNPLSVRKKKVKTTQVDGQPGGKEEGQSKRKRKRRGKNAGGNAQAETSEALNETAEAS